MGRLKRPYTEERPASVLAPTDSYLSSCAPTIERLRALIEKWEGQIITELEPEWARRPESEKAEVLGGYNDILTSTIWALNSIDRLLPEQEDASAYLAETQEHLLALVAFARKHVSAARDKDLAQERQDTRVRLCWELLTALEDFS